MDKMLRILILEDCASDIDLVEFELQEAGIAYTARKVMSEKEFIGALQEFSPDLILSDYDLPQYDGAAALAEVKARCPQVPFILITGALGEDRAIEMLTNGAKDYVMKNRLNRLVPAVRRALAEVAEFKARQEAEDALLDAHSKLTLQIEIKTAELQREITSRKWAEKDRDKRIDELTETVAKVKTLIGLLPVCPHCRKIQHDKGYLSLLEAFIGEHPEISFTKLICPACANETIRLDPATS